MGFDSQMSENNQPLASDRRRGLDPACAAGPPSPCSQLSSLGTGAGVQPGLAGLLGASAFVQQA